MPTVGFDIFAHSGISIFLKSNPGASAYEANTLSVELLELINIDHLKGDLVLLKISM